MEKGKNSNFPLVALLLIAAIQLSKQFAELTVTVLGMAIHVAQQLGKSSAVQSIGSFSLAMLVCMLIIAMLAWMASMPNFLDVREKPRKSELANQHTTKL